MSWLDNFDPQTISQQLALASISAQQSQLKNQQDRVTAQQKALTALKTALTDFQSALKGFSASGSNSGVVKNSATASQEGYVSLNASSSAKKGLYNINVKETASADQKAFEKLTDADIAAASGNISIGDKEVDIDMSTVSNLAGLRDKINAESGSSGATASLVKQNGQNILMISSDKTGEGNAITLSADDAALHQQLTRQATQISTAKDAVITMGEGAGAMTFTSSTNTFEDTIPGVELTVIRKTADGESLVINVENDVAGTREQAKAFVDAYNALRTKLDELTKSGGGEDSETRGALAGDTGISSLESKLNALLRSEFNGAKLSEFGITPDKHGQLTLDGTKFEEALKEKPDALNTLFDGTDGLLKRLEKEALDPFLKGTNGTLKQRQETLDKKSEQLTRKESQIETRYETTFNRYVKQFTNMKTIIAQMNQTMGQFF